MSEYTPREGSIAFRTFQHIEVAGETEKHALADAIDCDFNSLRPSLTMAINAGAIERNIKGGKAYYRSTRVPPVESAAVDGASATGVKEDLAAHPGAALVVDPMLAIAGQIGAASKTTPAADITDTKQAAELQSPKLLEALAPAQPTAPLPVPGRREGDAPRHFEHALWSDGRLSLEVGFAEITLSADETQKLFDYLDKVLGVDRGATA